MGKNNLLTIEVAYAAPNKQVILKVEIEQGSTLEDAIQQSGILIEFPEIKLAQSTIGVFSKKRQLSDLVQQGDRIEIYRSLTIDPKEARRAKAKATKNAAIKKP
jgi:putative ubiquitin-RnfH superfamily antitoxin RatB of RatAB toxin-antitoxin module